MQDYLTKKNREKKVAPMNEPAISDFCEIYILKHYKRENMLQKS